VPIPAFSPGLSSNITVVWTNPTTGQPQPFADDKYTFTGMVVVGTSIINILGILNPTAAGFTINVKNISASSLLGSGTAQIHVSAIHDPLS
jgi:hypothetical protein